MVSLKSPGAPRSLLLVGKSTIEGQLRGTSDVIKASDGRGCQRTKPRHKQRIKLSLGRGSGARCLDMDLQLCQVRDKGPSPGTKIAVFSDK